MSSDRYPQWPNSMSVTECIRAAGLMPEYSVADVQWYMDRGSAIHKATELYDKHTLDESTVAPEITGYLESYKKLNRTYQPGEIEIQLLDPIYLACGTLDRIDCDLKSGAFVPWHSVQASFYWQLKKINGLNPCPMNGIYLQEDGSPPKIKTYTIKEMMDGVKVFYAALAIVRWKQNNS